MMAFLSSNLIYLACLCAGICVMFATYIVVDFLSYTSSRYKEKFLEEAAVEMDDILLQLPPTRILDISMAIAALSAFIAVVVLAMIKDSLSISGSIAVAVIAALVTFPLPRVFLRWRRKQRLAKFNEQLEDALLSMSSSLKAGFSINQALETVAGENIQPISFEFTVLMQEVRLGVPLETALENMQKRTQSQDFELVSVAIITARQTGGELTLILERLAAVIRERVRISQRVMALTAQGRLQATLVGAVPFLLMFAMFFVAPDAMSAFFSSIIGIFLFVVVVVMVIMGFIIIKKITTIDV